jgi:hypothetical protein
MAAGAVVMSVRFCVRVAVVVVVMGIVFAGWHRVGALD